VQDFNGNELTRVYTDQFGTYNFITPSSYTVNAAIPTGVSPNMLRLCLNHPGPIPDPSTRNGFMTDPFFDNRFSLTCYTFDFWPGRTTYLDTPVIPVAAFTSIFNAILDCEQPDGTPVISDVTGPGAVGPIVNAGQTLTILSPGRVTIPNPECNVRFDPACAPTITRDYGFGTVDGTVKINGITIPPANVRWTNETIAVNVPAGTTTGQLEIIRGDNNQATATGITVTIGPLPPDQSLRTVQPGQSIQAAIDNALPGDLIIVRPGTYVGNFIVNKKVKLQGSSAFSTIINAAPTLPENLQNFRTRVQALIDAGQAQLVPGENLDLHLEFGALTVITNEGLFTQDDNARIDGFFMTSATSGGGVTANGFAHYLQISNNRIMNNAGAYGGGIRLGTPGLINPATGLYTDNGNDNIKIHHNQILMNGSVGATTGGGGVAIHNGTTNYQVTDNYICGNFTTSKGAGISHVGLSDNGLIARNKILLNESSFNSIQGGEGGGIIIRGEPALLPAVLSLGTGNVKVLDNLIQGNIAGNGKGGGIFVSFANGLDVQASADSANWYGIDIFNNMIANNVAGWVGGGIYLEDAAKVRIVHNTIANNSSTATGANALLPVGAGQATVPTGAGVVGGVHTAGLATVAAGQSHSDPLLQSNIIWRNTSFGYQADPNNPLVGLFPDPANVAGYSFWDLQVFNGAIEPPPVPAGLVLHPVNSVLTNLIGPDGVDYAANGNIENNPLFEEDFVYTLQSASAPGEGGNTVQVSFTPIGPRGDYHLQEGSLVRGIAPAPNPAIPEVTTDYDGEARAFPADIGADQFYPPPTVTFGDLKLTGPGGTQVVKTGETLTLTWTPGATFPQGVTYKLMVSYKNGKSWKKIPGAEALTGTTFDWVVPAQARNVPQARLRVQAFNGRSLIGQDISPEPFEIEVVKVLYPSDARVEVGSGLTLAPPFGINFRFNETLRPVAAVRVEYSIRGRGGWKAAEIAEGNPFLNPVKNQEHQLTWTVPTVTQTTTTAKIRVRLLDENGRAMATDESDLPITILPVQ
jgi:hypothetical protein